MYFLAIDPASCTGYAIGKVSNNDITLEDHGIIEVKHEVTEGNSSVGRTCNAMYENVESILDRMTERPTCVYIEDYFFSSRARNGVNLNLYLRGAVAMVLDKKEINYKFVSPSEWKSFVTGIRSGRPTKHMKDTWGTQANKKIIVDKLKERYDIDFPDTITINGRKRKFKYDISDATGILLYGIHTDYPSARVSHTETSIRH